MYSIPPVCGKKPFDTNNLPSSMYPMKPYYHGLFGDQSSQNVRLPTGPLPIPEDLDLNDRDTRMALEDLLSRQMLLFCRLNDMERVLIQNNDIKVEAKKLTGLKIVDQKQEDIVIHFHPDHPPLTLITVLRLLAKEFPTLKMLINYHVHSSLLNDSEYSKLKTILEKLRFQPSNIEENTERNKYPIIFTFIAKKLDSECYAIFKSTQPPIVGELNILKKISFLVSQTDNELEKFWQLLLESDLKSDQVCIGNLAKYFLELGGNNFLLQSSQPRLIDVIVWSFSQIPQNQCRAFKSLVDPKWSLVIQSFF